MLLVLVMNAVDESQESQGRVFLVCCRLLVPSRFHPLGLECHRLVEGDWQDRGAINEAEWAAEKMLHFSSWLAWQRWSSHLPLAFQLRKPRLALRPLLSPRGHTEVCSGLWDGKS